MAEKEFLPAGLEYAKFLIEGAKGAKDVGIDTIFEMECKKADDLSKILADINNKIAELKDALNQAHNVAYGHTLERATVYRDKVNVAMYNLRQAVDTMEAILPRKYYPMPTYVDLLFGVN